MLFIAAFASIFGLNSAAAKGREQLAIGLLFGLGLLLGLAVAPVIADYAAADPSALWQAAGATAAFVAALGAHRTTGGTHVHPSSARSDRRPHRRYLYDILVGLAVGATVGLAGVWARRRTGDGPPQIALSFSIPFLAGLAGHAASASPIAAIIAAGFVVEAFYSGRGAPERPYSASTQALGRAFWQQATLLLSGALAFIVGLSNPTALEGIEIAPAPLIGYVAEALALVTTTRFLIAWASAGRRRDSDRVPRAKEGLMLAWGGGRTPLAFVVALLVRATIETGAPFPDRDLLLVFAAALVVASAALQGTTVAALARRLGLDGDHGEQREEQAARERLAAARRAHPRTTAASQRERGEVSGAERAALVHLYDADEIGEDTMLRLRHEIDLEAQRRSDGTLRPNPGRATPR